MCGLPVGSPPRYCGDTWQFNAGVNFSTSARGWSHCIVSAVGQMLCESWSGLQLPSRSYNAFMADSVSVVHRWKAGSQMWHLKKSDVGWWELEPADGLNHVPSSCCWLHYIPLSPEGRLLAFTSTLVLCCCEDTDGDGECRDIRAAPPAS